MAVVSRDQIKSWFRIGLKPLEVHFASWIDSFWHKNDAIPMSSIDGLNDALNQRTISIDDALSDSSTNPVQNRTVKQALDAQRIEVDSSLSGTSENPVQNKVLTEALGDKAAADHNHNGVYQPAGNYAASDHTHPEYLTQHQDISHKQDKTDNSLPTTSKTIIGAIAELWNKFADYALSNHNHDAVYAAKSHNHNGVYQPAGNYADANHTHSQYLTQHQDISHKQDKTDNSLPTTSKTIIGAIAELWNKFADYLKGIQHVTYVQLVTLRNNGELKPGQQYRITDFVTTVANDTEARSAGHPFDIIAVADDATTLNENARAVKHAGDTYFQNSKLSAWKLKYSLDNDTTRWFHADPENGKGVIYFMEDEFGNIGECDFKNFQYKRYKVTDDSADGILGSLDGQYVGFDEEMKDLIIEDMNDYIWAYAASMPSYTFDDETEELEFDMQNQLDATLNQIPEGAGIDADGGGYAHPVIYCKGNKFTAHQVAVSVDDGEWTYPMRASNIVLFCYPKYFEGDDDIPARIEFENSADNVFAPDCDFITMNGVSARNTFLTAYSNIIFGGSVGRSIFKGQYSCCTFGGNIVDTTFGGYIWDTTFGGNIGNSTFGGYIGSSTFGGGIYNATFGGDIRNTTFGGDIGYTTFGGNIVDTTFGGNIWETTFGGEIYRATFGGYIGNSTFGGNIVDTTFGGYILYTTFGGYIERATFGGDIGNTTFGGDIRNTTFGGNIVDTTFGGEIYRATFGGGIYNATFGGEIWNTTFGGYINGATFGGYIGDSTFGGYIERATFGGNIWKTTFGGNIVDTTFGGNIGNSTFGGYIGSSTFGGGIYNATFGGDIRNTTFGGDIGYTTFGGNIVDTTFGGNIWETTFGGEIYRATFGGYIGNSTFGGNIVDTTFGGYILYTTFGGGIYNTTFGGYIERATFGGYIGNSTFGGYINGATFGGEIWNTTFGGNIVDTTFGGYIERATFGGEIYRATFGGEIWNTTFGGGIYNATFGGYIERATFGGNLHNGHIHGYLYNVSIGSAGETWTNLVIDPGVEYVSVTCTESGDADIKNVHIFGGVSGTYDNPITVSIPTRNNALLEIKPTTKTEILV